MAVDIDAIDREIARRTLQLKADIRAGLVDARETYRLTIDDLLDRRLKAMAAAKTTEPA